MVTTTPPHNTHTPPRQVRYWDDTASQLQHIKQAYGPSLAAHRRLLEASKPPQPDIPDHVR